MYFFAIHGLYDAVFSMVLSQSNGDDLTSLIRLVEQSIYGLAVIIFLLIGFAICFSLGVNNEL